ncbi:DUF4138 domain-containing protein [Cesiribacter andamanensis]|uniref:Conjugative transposon TraN protein n=1 Tax=Cesiribacter andamanensis AMV16 TaxID=1279009 RepID=M7N0W4_9BACT|nr:DUF4138 domain-containing protein [Cesiribacter andamanensis]EMR02303.1 conjugative transposon TraN protein [Cesiribacter andamanensis AMV16]
MKRTSTLLLVLLLPLAGLAQMHAPSSAPGAAAPGAAAPGVATPGAAAPGAAAQDTLFVTDTETTYLLFPGEVQLVDIGRPGDYFARIEGQSVFLKARSQQSGPTNLLVRFGEAYYTARLAVANSPSGRLYDLRSSPVYTAATRGTRVRKEGADPASFQASLLRLQHLPHTHASPRNTRHGMQLRLVQLQIDEEALYLGLSLQNNSSIAYTPDYVGFTYQERRGRRFSRNNRYQKEVRPIAELAPAVLPAREVSTLWYALPLYAMSARGRLQLQFRESGGARNLRILLPARWINQAPTFPKGHEH